MQCWNPYDFAKVANSSDEYCGPLSLLTTSGIPWRAKTDLSAKMTAEEVVDDIFITSGYLEKKSTTKR